MFFWRHVVRPPMVVVDIYLLMLETDAYERVPRWRRLDGVCDHVRACPLRYDVAAAPARM